LVEFRLNELGILQQLQDVASGQLDVGIIRLPVKSAAPELTISAIYRDPIILAIPARHPLAKLKAVPAGRLRNEPFVAVQIQEGVGFNAQVAELCAVAGLTPQITQRAGQFTALVGMVAGGLGLAFVPSSVKNLKIPDVVYRPVSNSDQKSDLAMVHRKSERAPVLLSFIKELKQAARPG
jgi:DNA-binding transcriptional LysR family regulator